jgi:hypothetical protein
LWKEISFDGSLKEVIDLGWVLGKVLANLTPSEISTDVSKQNLWQLELNFSKMDMFW